MNKLVSEQMLRREAEYLRWNITGGEGGLDDSRWVASYSAIEDEVSLFFKTDRAYVCIPHSALLLSLDVVSEEYIRPFVSKLPSVLASARVKGDLEYASWGPA